MPRCQALYEKALRSPGNLRFTELCRLAECYGYEESRRGRTSGSHLKYKHSRERIPARYAMMNFQPLEGGRAKRFEIDQLVEAIGYLVERYPGEYPPIPPHAQ
jgi:hypothetical protein